MPEFWENPWVKYLEEIPRAPFYAMAQPFVAAGGTSGGRKAESVFSDALNEYYGAVGQQILSGKTPSLTFTSFLQNYGDTNQMFPYAERFGAKGRQFGDTTRYAPRTRSLFF